MKKVAGIILGVVTIASVTVFSFEISRTASAGSSENVSGYAWSSNIGLISLNNLGPGDGTNYGVNIDTAGNFSGYGWSPNIGWVSFNPSLTGCPLGGVCAPRLNWATGAVSGWARACAGTAAGNCSSSASRTDGWDGWIQLSGLMVNTTTGDFSGYAWGSDVVGWVDFSGVNVGSLPIPPTATAPTLTATTCTIAANQSTCPGRVTWVIQNATNPNVYNQTRSASCGTGATGANAPCTLGYGNNTIRARDNTTLVRDIIVTAACPLSAPWNGTVCVPAAAQCNDTTDNDGDLSAGWGADFPNDPGCSNANDTTESPNPACSNNSDDDGDTFFDVNDPGCENSSGVYDPRDTDESNLPLPQCNDGIDNDSDGKTDWDGNGTPANADPGCTSATDTSEFNIGSIRPR